MNAHHDHGPQCDGCLMLKMVAERDALREKIAAVEAMRGPLTMLFGEMIEVITRDDLHTTLTDNIATQGELRTAIEGDLDAFVRDFDTYREEYNVTGPSWIQDHIERLRAALAKGGAK